MLKIVVIRNSDADKFVRSKKPVRRGENFDFFINCSVTILNNIKEQNTSQIRLLN